MPMFAPPWLKKLGSDASPLVDDAEVQDEIVRMKLQMEREDRQRNGELFAGPMVEPTPSAVPALPFGDLTASAPAPSERFEQPVQPPAPGRADQPMPAVSSPVPRVGGSPLPPGLDQVVPPSYIAPPGAPPPPPPADRPPGMFRFDPENPDRLKPDEDEDEF